MGEEEDGAGTGVDMEIQIIKVPMKGTIRGIMKGTIKEIIKVRVSVI